MCTPDIPFAQETRLRRSMGGFEPRLLVLYATGHHACTIQFRFKYSGVHSSSRVAVVLIVEVLVEVVLVVNGTNSIVHK